jgi:hypothetical protein
MLKTDLAAPKPETQPTTIFHNFFSICVLTVKPSAPVVVVVVGLLLMMIMQFPMTCTQSIMSHLPPQFGHTVMFSSLRYF